MFKLWLVPMLFSSVFQADFEQLVKALILLLLPFRSQSCTHRRRLWGSARARAPPIIEKRPCIDHFLPPSAPRIVWFAHPILLTSLRQCLCSSITYPQTFFVVRNSNYNNIKVFLLTHHVESNG